MKAIHIEQGLTHKDSIVRSVFAERNDFTPTPEQIERGLSDEDWFVRMAFIKRKDFTPSPEQIERGLTDARASVRHAFAVRHAEWEVIYQSKKLREQFQPNTTEKIRKVL